MQNQKRTWWQVLINMIVVGGTVTVLSVGSRWMGVKLWGFFRRPPSPPSSGESAPLPSQQDQDPLREETSTALVGESRGVDRITNAHYTVRSLLFEKRNVQHLIRTKKVLILEKEAQIRISDSDTKAIEKCFDSLRSYGVSQEQIERDMDYPRLAVEESIRNTHREQIVALQDEIKNLEASIAHIPEPLFLLDEAAAPRQPESTPLAGPLQQDPDPLPDGISTLLTGGAQETTGTPRPEIQVLNWELKQALVKEKQALIRESNTRSASIERKLDKMRVLGVTKEQIKNDPLYPQLDEEHDIRTPLFDDIEELQKEIAILEEGIPEIKKGKIKEEAVRKHRRLPRRQLRASSSRNHNPWNIHPNPRNLDLGRNQSLGSSDSDSLRISSGESKE